MTVNSTDELRVLTADCADDADNFVFNIRVIRCSNVGIEG